MKILLVKQLNGTIIPSYDEDKERLKRFKAGEPFMAEVTKPRNIKFHRKTFSLFNMVFDNQENYISLDHLRKDITIEAGYYDEYTSITTGEIKREAKSISFAAMDDLEFGEYYNKILDVIVKFFHFDKEQIIDNVEQYY